MELLHQPQDIVADRYRIANIIGQGGMGTTYEAEDLQTQLRVAVKGLSLNRMADWKVLELFEREARVLSHLNHPAIPRYIDYFEVETPDRHGFYLVQELAEGQSLFSLVESGWHSTESEVRQIASQILDILIYLHALTPPVIHRDIKPHNIIRRSDGQIFLVDFGSVKATYQNTIAGGSTIVGTYGYMAPEQFSARAFPASDLYSLGATLLFILTHRSPAEFPSRQLKINFRSQLPFSSEFANWLDKLLEPAVENRFLSAKEAVSVLKGDGVLVPHRRRPAGTRIAIAKTDKRLVAEIPRNGWNFGDIYSFVFASILLTVSSFFLTLLPLIFISPLFLLFPLIAIILGMFGLVKIKDDLFKLLGRTKLEIDRQNFRVRWSILGVFYQVQGRIQDIDRIELNKFVRPEIEWLAKLKNEIPQSIISCALVEGIRVHRFGCWLTPVEKDWLVQEMAAFLKKPLSLQ